MAQADSASTTLYEFLSRPAHKRDEVERAHKALLAKLATTKPQLISGDADACEVQARADHLRDVFDAVRIYVTEVISDTAWRSMVPIDVMDPIDYFSDVASDTVGVIQKAADRYPCDSARHLVRYYAETAR